MRLVDALFDKRWELQRQRRRQRARSWLLALVLGAIVYVALTQVRGQPHRLGSASAAAITRGPVTSESLPRVGQYSSLATIGGKLIVWGGTEGAVESVPAATSSGATCQAAEVNPKTLVLGVVQRGSCLNPALLHERVLPDLAYLDGGPSGDIGTLRISVISATARGGYALGPVLLRYVQCSDCELSLAYGDGSLWVYAPNVLGVSSSTGRLLRISEQTGRAVQSWRLPALYQALLAINREGLWVAPSLYSGLPEYATAVQRRNAASLYRVSAGMRAPQREFLIGRYGTRWLVASGASVWLDTGTPAATRLIRLDGPAAHLAFTAKLGAPECGELGKGPSSIAGDDTGGIYCLSADGKGTGTVYRFGAESGTGHQVASIPGVDTEEFEQPAAIVGSSYFFLQPPVFSYGRAPELKATAHGAGVLYRINGH